MIEHRVPGTVFRTSDGVDSASLEMMKVVPRDASAPLPIHLGNHGLAISEANGRLAEMNHRSLERGAVDLVCTPGRYIINQGGTYIAIISVGRDHEK